MSFGHVGIRTVHSLDMFAERAGICVALGAAGEFAHIWLLIGVGPILVLGTVTGVAEGLAAAFLLTHIRLLTGVRPKVCLQVFEA